MIFEVSTQLINPDNYENIEDAPAFVFLGFVEADDKEQAMTRAKETFGHIDKHPAIQDTGWSKLQ